VRLLSYTVVRYVPDVCRGEFENVAVICGSDATSWLMQIKSGVTSLTSFDLLAFLEELQRRVVSGEVDEAYLRRSVGDAGIIQYKPLQPSVGLDGHVDLLQTLSGVFLGPPRALPGGLFMAELSRLREFYNAAAKVYCSNVCGYAVPVIRDDVFGQRSRTGALVCADCAKAGVEIE